MIVPPGREVVNVSGPPGIVAMRRSGDSVDRVGPGPTGTVIVNHDAGVRCKGAASSPDGALEMCYQTRAFPGTGSGQLQAVTPTGLIESQPPCPPLLSSGPTRDGSRWASSG